MPRFEEDFFHSLSVSVREITKQIEIMNKLKCIELKAKYQGLTSTIDSIEAQIES